MTLTELREQMARLLADVKPLALKAKGGEALTEEEERRYDELIGQINRVGPELRAAEGRAASAAVALEQDNHYNAPAGARASGLVPNGRDPNGNGNDPNGNRGVPAWRAGVGRRFAASDEVRSWTGGRSAPVAVGAFRPSPDELRDLPPDELRALIYTGALPADMILPTIVPGIFRGAEAPLNMRDVLISGRTTSDTITYMRELLYTNAAAEVAQATATTGASGLKPESALTFEQASAPVVTIAHWIPITRQTIEDAPQLQTYVEQRLLTGLDRREDNQILNGDGTGANMTGLRNTSGVQILNAAHFTGAPVQNAGTSNENINRIRRGKRMVRVVGQALPTFVVVHPTALETFETLTDGNRQYLMGDPFSGAAIPRLWGLRVVESENIATNQALVGDSTAAAVWDRADGRIMIDTINDQFVRNMLTILAEERLALAVYRPAAFALVDLV